MNTREHLIYLLQDHYSFERDYLAHLLELHHGCRNERLRALLDEEHIGLRSEMDTTERCLHLLGARYKQERNAVVPGIKEASQRFVHQTNPTRDQMDIHSALEVLKVARMIAGGYEGDIELARAIGEQDVAKLLEENLARQMQSITGLQRFLPKLVTDISRSEASRAA